MVTLGGDFPCGPRHVETRLFRQSLPWLAAIIPIVLGVAWLLRGNEGLASAAIGTLLGVGNLGLSALVMERAGRVGGNALILAALVSYVVRLAILFVVFILLEQLDFIDAPTLGIVLAGTYLGLLVIEAFAVVASDRAVAQSAQARLRPSGIDGVNDAPTSVS